MHNVCGVHSHSPNKTSSEASQQAVVKLKILFSPRLLHDSRNERTGGGPVSAGFDDRLLELACVRAAC